MKAGLRGTFTVMNAHIRKNRVSPKNNPIMHLQFLEKKNHTNSKPVQGRKL